MSETIPLIQTENLTMRFGGVVANDNITFSLREMELRCLIGPNGMGKTTLLRSLMGQLPATGGKVTFAGTDITRRRPHERSRLGLGLVPQGREIFPELSVMDNLRMGLAAAPKEDAAMIDTVLQDFPRLKPLLERRGGALSGGEQQLLALARCLCTKPKLILLDEPTEGIQPSIIEEMIDTLLALKARWALSLVVVEQNLEFLTSLSDRILKIQKGRITGETSREEILSGKVSMDAI